MEEVFWITVAAMVYVLIAYPAIMVGIGLAFRARISKGKTQPTITLIVAACNEERFIGRMMEQIRQLDYPRDRLEAVVASDAGSTDRTHAIVRSHEQAGIRLCLPDPQEIGKNVSLDRAVATTSGEILIFADATAIWDPGALRAMVANFADPRVGCVAARKAYWLEDGFGPSSYRRYWDLEGMIDAGSSRLGYIPNASGGLHALRRDIYQVVPNYMIRDLIDPAQAAGAGHLSILDATVPYVDAPWVGAAEVYWSRVRITMRALSSTPYILGQLLGARRYLAVWQFVSHKLLRWFLWMPALTLLLSSVWLASQSIFYAAAALLQVLLYAAVPVGLVAARRGRRISGLADWSFFVVSLVAMAHGLSRSLRGQRKATWRLREPEIDAQTVPHAVATLAPTHRP